jgi:hypothetical protein
LVATKPISAQTKRNNIMTVSIGPGWSISPGWELGSGTGGGGGGGTPGVNNVTGFAEMPPPIVPGVALEDPTATVNGSVGFTINDDTKTGVGITALTASNDAFFATYGTGTKTCTWGPGSTVASSTIIVGTNNPLSFPQLAFVIQGQTGPATYNYPFTFS